MNPTRTSLYKTVGDALSSAIRENVPPPFAIDRIVDALLKDFPPAIAQPPSVKIGDGKGRGLPEDVRSFVERVTLHLQKKNDDFFKEAYRLYDKYDVEGWHEAKRAAQADAGGEE